MLPYLNICAYLWYRIYMLTRHHKVLIRIHHIYIYLASFRLIPIYGLTILPQHRWKFFFKNNYHANYRNFGVFFLLKSEIWWILHKWPESIGGTQHLRKKHSYLPKSKLLCPWEPWWILYKWLEYFWRTQHPKEKHWGDLPSSKCSVHGTGHSLFTWCWAWPSQHLLVFIPPVLPKSL